MLVHSVEVRVFCKEDEDCYQIVNALEKLIPFGLEKEKLSIKKEKVYGFNEKEISIFSLKLQKKGQIRQFLSYLLSRLQKSKSNFYYAKKNPA
ncbi:MAG: RNA-binding domain-containing protein [Candidatus Woesearchaeota archaeon]